MIAAWYPLFSSGYLANRRGGGADWPNETPHPSPRILKIGPVRPDRPEVEPERGVDDVKDDDAVSTMPAIQWHVTQSNSTPTFGRNAVNSSVNIDAAITQ